MTSPWVPHVIVAVSPRRAETVPRRRTVEVLEEDGWKACSWEGRTRGVERDIVADLFIVRLLLLPYVCVVRRRRLYRGRFVVVLCRRAGAGSWFGLWSSYL